MFGLGLERVQLGVRYVSEHDYMMFRSDSDGVYIEFEKG